MTVSYAEAKAEVGRLVDRFARLNAHNRKHYNEPATRQEFTLPTHGQCVVAERVFDRAERGFNCGAGVSAAPV